MGKRNTIEKNTESIREVGLEVNRGLSIHLFLLTKMEDKITTY